jgi:hypothetical protein
VSPALLNSFIVFVVGYAGIQSGLLAALNSEMLNLATLSEFNDLRTRRPSTDLLAFWRAWIARINYFMQKSFGHLGRAAVLAAHRVHLVGDSIPKPFTYGSLDHQKGSLASRIITKWLALRCLHYPCDIISPIPAITSLLSLRAPVSKCKNMANR